MNYGHIKSLPYFITTFTYIVMDKFIFISTSYNMFADNENRERKKEQRQRKVGKQRNREYY